MAGQEKIIDHLNDLYSEFEASLNGLSGKPLHDLQRRSFDALKQVQFPDRKHEDWKYTSVQKLIAPPYQLASKASAFSLKDIDGLDTHVITIFNGKVLFKEIPSDLSQQGIRIIPVHESLEDTSWKTVFAKWILTENISANRAFEFLNFTFQTTGFFLDIPKNVTVDKPVEIRILHDDESNSFSHPLYFVRCGSGSSLTLLERFETNTNNEIPISESLINSVGYIHLDSNASVKHLKWQDLPSGQNLVYKLFVTQYRDSRFETFAFDHGGNLVRNNVEVELEENNTYTSLQAAYLASG
ncbi:MAG: SufD family Fe-S cluster assembly protein, partial [Bacteroidota bacterium]|nr:SufD family Fe-S cluster assembly protein [Bacteroidota bacterium]